MKPSRLASLALLLVAPLAAAQGYAPADVGQRPAKSGTAILPETFLRGFDPVTVYYPSDQVGDRANADDAKRRVRLAPDWPGAWVWVDKRTLQFRPAEPWPALARFFVDAGSARAALTTMMSAPSSMTPSPGSEGLKPFRVVTLTFPQQLPLQSLKKMLTVEIRDLPGLKGSPSKRVDRYALAPLPRANHRMPAVWALTLDEDVPEGRMLVVSVALALGNEGTTLWEGRASTRLPFTLTQVRCGNAEAPVTGADLSKDQALGCGNRGDMPQLVFSAPVQDLTLTQLRQLVRLEPAVPDLHFQAFGSRVQLQGKFVPDTLYSMTLGSAPAHDDAGRLLSKVPPLQLYFHLGWKASFLRWNDATALVEVNGPRNLPLTGYGESRADVRVHRVDPLHTGLWPFPQSPVVIDESSAPPFPGEEPSVPSRPGVVDSRSLSQHLRLLGSPLVSRVVDLPAGKGGDTATFGLDLGPLLDDAVGRRRPGTYLVGLRRLTGRPERAWVRVQVTNLSLTAVEETARAILYVRALDTGGPVGGAVVTLEGTERKSGNVVKVSQTSDGDGRVAFGSLSNWSSITRISATRGEDVLVLDPRESPPAFANNHWSSSGRWLQWLTTTQVPGPVNDTQLGFLFTERAIYRPGEAVYLKGFVREKVKGVLTQPTNPKRFGLQVRGPDGATWRLPVTVSPLGGFAATFQEKQTPTGDFTAELFDTHPGSVVARRSFKIEAYRVPTFEVQLAGPTRTRNDKAFEVKAVARYYAGGQVANQPIVWNVSRRPHYWMPSALPGFLFASSTQFARPQDASAPGGTRQEGSLDDQGAGNITMHPELDLDGSARVYHFEATVTGPDEQPITAATDVEVLPAFVLGLNVPRYLPKATSLSPRVVAVGVDDKLQAGQEVRVRLFRRVWHSSLRETSFATGQAKYVTEQEDVKVGEQLVTTGDKPVTPSFKVKDSGVYVVELFARDRLGRVQTLSADLYIGGETPQNWQKARDGVFSLTPDKKTYAPGDTAHVVVQSPFTRAKALVVVEEPQGNRYLWREVEGSTTVIDLPIEGHFVPNLPVHVVLMRGRLGEGKADDARYKPATVASSIQLEVEPVRNTVNVELEHPEVARPGTKQIFTVKLSDEKKRPLSGEVTFWLVDEAVLSLAKEGPLDPLTSMIRRNSASVSIRDTRNLVVGRLAQLDEDPGGDGGEEEEAQQGGRRRVRKNFKTVPVYLATVTVPASGRVSIPVQLSDDLTNFQVRAVAVSGAQRFGFEQSTLRVRLPVLVQPQLPRFVRAGDQFWPGGVARVVEGPEGAASVDIEVRGAVTGKGGAKEQIELKTSKAASVLTPVTVVKQVPTSGATMTVKVDVTRLVDKVGDAFEVQLPVLPDVMPEKSAVTTRVGPGAFTPKGFPEPPRPGTGKQTMVFTSEPGILELASALDYLSAYPHGCLEQRMSQVTPDLALGGLFNQLQLDTRFTPQLKSSVKRILDELALHQDQQGFLGYWPGSSGDVALTAQGLEFMVLAKRAGVAVDEPVKRRTVEALRRVLRSDFNGRWAAYAYNQQTAALRALAKAGVLDENYLIELFHQRRGMDAVSLADLTSGMAERPDLFSSNLGALKGELWDSVVFKLVKGKPVFERIQGDRSAWHGLYLGSQSATIAAVWEALLKVDPNHEKHPLVRDALVAQSTPVAGFGSTHANRRALAALGTYLERGRPPTTNFDVKVDGVGGFTLSKEHRAMRKVLTADAAPRMSVVGGEVGARFQYEWLPGASGDQVASRKEGLVVSRSLTWLHGDSSAPTHHDDKAGATLKVPQGEVLEVHVNLVTDEPRTHVALVVPLAGGMEPLNPELMTSGSDARPSRSDSLRATYVQRLDDEVRYYFTELPRGSHQFHFRVRATSEGSFVYPAPWAEMMYREAVRGRGEGMRLVVTGAHQK